jgi:P4 family phage/plasmid primase-like protien
VAKNYHSIESVAFQAQSPSNHTTSNISSNISWDELPLHPDHQRDLQKSGLTPETVKAAGIYTARPGDIDRLVGWHDDRITSALVIPYPGIEDFYRLKVFPPFVGKDGHTNKYLQPKETNPCLYIPHKSQASLHNINTPLFVVEGEKKSLKGSQEGLGCVVGIGGVWSWRKNGRVIAQIESIPVKGRKVEIVPDSDWKTDEHINAAVKELRGYFVSRGADVVIVNLPEWGDGKTGLDDYLRSNSLSQYYRLTRTSSRKKKSPTALGGETPLSDQYNAEIFVKLHGEDVRYCYAWSKWLVWTGKRWVKDDSGEVIRLAKQTVKGMAGSIPKADDKRAAELLQHIRGSLSERRIKAMLVLAQSEPGMQVKAEQLNTDPYLLNCRNCTVDLPTGEMRAHSRDDLITKMINDSIDYIPTAQCPNWESAMLRFMSGKQHMVDFMQRATGYSFTGDVKGEHLFFMYGEGQNGKTTYSETIQELLADYFQKAPISMLTMGGKTRKEAASPDVARLHGVRMVIANEVQEGSQLNESQVKDLTGGDTITARNLYEGYFDFEPTHKVWMYGNHRPKISGTDDGIWRRPKLIEFNAKIPESEKIEGYRKSHLVPELSGILAWVVRGAIEWHQSGLQVPAEVMAATSEYRDEMDVVQRFIEEKCEVNKYAKVEIGALYSAFKRWSVLNNEDALTGRTFGLRMTAKGFGDAKSGSTRYRLGIGLNIEDNSEEGPF